jgi:hypothetical protein
VNFVQTWELFDPKVLPDQMEQYACQ